MSEFFIKAKQDRRRAGIRFTKGLNGPFEVEDFSEDQLKALEGDPFLTASAGEKSKPVTDGTKKRSGGRGQSAAQKRAEKKAADEAAKLQQETDAQIAKVSEAIKALPKGMQPTVEAVSKAIDGVVTEDELKAAIKQIERGGAAGSSLGS